MSAAEQLDRGGSGGGLPPSWPRLPPPQHSFLSQTRIVQLASWANGPEAREVISRYLNYALGPNSRRAYMHDEGLEAWIPAACHLADHSKNTHIQNLMQQINAKGIKVRGRGRRLGREGAGGCFGGAGMHWKGGDPPPPPLPGRPTYAQPLPP